MNSYHDIDVPMRGILDTLEDAEDRVKSALASVKRLREPLADIERQLADTAFQLKSAWFEYYGRCTDAE